jgi:hypothetical protein
MKVMISQPRYLPAMNYIDRINSVDVFIVLDTVQRTERGWENRNLINGKWLTMPVCSSSRTLIKDAVINGTEWRQVHKNKIDAAYRQHYVNEVYEQYLKGFCNAYAPSLIEGLKYVCKFFGIKTKIVRASEISNVTNGGIQELFDLTKKVGGTTYVSGPTCLDYGLTHELAESNGLRLKVHDHYDKRNFLDYVAAERMLFLQSRQA